MGAAATLHGMIMRWLLLTLPLMHCSPADRACPAMACLDQTRVVFTATGALPPGPYLVLSTSCRVQPGSTTATCASPDVQPVVDRGVVVGFTSSEGAPGDTSVPSLSYDGKVIATATSAPEKTTRYINGEDCPGTCTITTVRGNLAPPPACSGC